MRKGLIVVIAAALVVAAGVVLFSLSSPVLREDTEYEVASLYYRGQEVSGQVDTEAVADLLQDCTRGLISRGRLPTHSYAELVEIGLQGEEDALIVVLFPGDGLCVAYRDPDWCYTIREGEALTAAVEALLPA